MRTSIARVKSAAARANSDAGDAAGRSATFLACIENRAVQAIKQSMRLTGHSIPAPGDVRIRPHDQQVFQRTRCRLASINIEDRERNAKLHRRVDPAQQYC
jgi:hypothetical protein